MPPIRATVVHVAAVCLALVVAVAPRPPDVVERWYARGVYPTLQAAVTTASNAVPIAVFDVVVVAALAWALWTWGRAARRAQGRRSLAPLVPALRATLAGLAGAYLWFVAIWGLNYARPPLDARLGLPTAAATPAEVAALLDEAVAQANRLYADSQADDVAFYDADGDVARGLRVVEARHGRARATVPGRPKPTGLALYFRVAGVDGLTAPAALETLLNPDLTAAERPFVLAHEWAHLSGYAPEADASFVAWLVTMEPGAKPRTHYSGWLFLLSETAVQVPPEQRRTAVARLGTGPRRDLDAIAARARLQVDLVQRVGWRIYDRYLRSQGVREGVVSYSRVVDLIARASRSARPRGGAGRPVPQ